jgi:hypothetical protein
MALFPNGGPRYEVHLSGLLARQFQGIQEQASLEGRGDAVLRAFREIIDKLENDPNGFGEPLYRLPALRMQIRHGAILPLFIDYGVCEDRPLVFLKGFTLLPPKEL